VFRDESNQSSERSDAGFCILLKVIAIVKLVVVEAVGKVGIPRFLRDFQAPWEPRFPGVSTARLCVPSMLDNLEVQVLYPY